MPMLLLNINPESTKCAKRAVITKRLSLYTDYSTLIFQDQFSIIIGLGSKSRSPNQLARRTAVTLSPRRTAVLFLLCNYQTK